MARHQILAVQPPLCLVVDLSRGGSRKKEGQLNDRKALNGIGLLALQRPSARHKGGIPAAAAVQCEPPHWSNCGEAPMMTDH